MNSRILTLTLTVVVALVTLFVRIPLPSRGYFNVGDAAVIFAGLVLGGASPKHPLLWGALAGGLGSAAADILSGFALFAPLTLAAKGLEGALAAAAAKHTAALRWIWAAVASSAMVIVYFVGEALWPSIGLQGALAELLPNLLQAAGGTLIGVTAFGLVERTGWLRDDDTAAR